MIEYPKIENAFKRNPDTHELILSEYRLPEFDYLRNNQWYGTEKIDGTNIRVNINTTIGSTTIVTFDGRTDRAEIPPFLHKELEGIFTPDKLLNELPDVEMTLYGEGFGAKIQKGGGNYIADRQSFILFDVRVGGWWLKQEDVEEIAHKLSIQKVPLMLTGTLAQAKKYVSVAPHSSFSDDAHQFPMEGLVLRPQVDLLLRNGQRIITKMKVKDLWDGKS